MRTVSYKLADLSKVVIHLGKVAENDATRVRIDSAEVFRDYPAAQVALSVTNPVGETYPATVQRDGDFVVWDVKDSSLTAEGDGEIQISFSQSGAKIRSDIGRTKICRSIIGEGETPDPVQDWVDQAEELLEEIENAIPAGGTTGQVLAKASGADFDTEWVDQGSGGTVNYNDLENKPQIGGVTLTGDTSLASLGAASTEDIPDISGLYTKPDDGIPSTDMTSAVQTSLGKADSAYQVPSGGIPSTDMATAVQTSLGKADSAYQKPGSGIPGTDLASGVLTSIIDDTAGAGDTNKILSADKVMTALSNKADKTDTVLLTTLSRGRKANTTVGYSSFAFGDNVTASGEASHAEGTGTVASALQSHAEGYGTTASGEDSHAEGVGGTYLYNGERFTSEARGKADHTEGYQCSTEIAASYNSENYYGNHAEGCETRATGGAAHSEGYRTLASGLNSHAEGSYTQATEFTAHAEGDNTFATGVSSHTEGFVTKAMASYSHAEGQGTTASGVRSHAEGFYTTASGMNSHAEGVYSVSDGPNSHAEGVWTIAKGEGSHTGGWYNIEDNYASWPEWQPNTQYYYGDKVKVTDSESVTGYIANNDTIGSSFDPGYWTVDEKRVFAEIIGNGENDEDRSNARALDWDGNEYLAGEIYVGCNDDSTGGTRLAKITELPAFATDQETQSIILGA